MHCLYIKYLFLNARFQLNHVRRYGVVDGRFCFEGGSRCGKGEGLYVFVTDLGDEITHTLKLAAQSKLATKRRGALSRKMSALESPRKQPLSPRQTDDHHSFHPDETINRNSYWPSQESRVDLDSNYGCGDTVSVSELNDSFNNDSGAHFPRAGQANIERCMSCISKLGAPSMSRSSTATGAGTPASGQPPNWSLLANEHAMHQPMNHQAKIMQGLDRMSVCSSHGSYGSSGDSEYSVPRQSMCQSSEGWYEPSVAACPHNCPSAPRPPPKSISKPAMPLPATSTTSTVSHVGPYENYDVPRTPVQVEPSASGNPALADLYDTPKKIQEYLNKDNAHQHHQHHHHHHHNDQQPQTIGSSDKYGNYDMPAMCGCMPSMSSGKDAPPRNNCTCNRVMSWADNWISLPYCRRGNGVENTSLPINKVKLSGEGKMPVVQPSGELAIYATVDMAKKIRRKLLDEGAADDEDGDNDGQTCECEHEVETDISANYINLAPGGQQTPEEATAANYTNLEFALSLENYENAKEVLQKAGFSVGNLQETLQQCLPRTKLCPKCGHASRKTKLVLVDNQNVADKNEETVRNDKPEDYMLMEPGKSKRNLSGYLPMSPAAPPLPCKDLIRRLIAEKSASNPSLCGPAVDRSRKRSENGARVPGSCMMNLHKSGGSPYTRKQLMDNSDDLTVVSATSTLGRKRSSSVDSTRVVEEQDADFAESAETLRKSSLDHIEGRRSSSPCIHQETEQCPDQRCCLQSRPVDQPNTEDDTSISTTTSAVTQSASVYIRRSASVPCKAQNRDSSSSNDSGVSTGSMRPSQKTNGEFPEFELPLTTSFSSASHHRHHHNTFMASVHHASSSLPRRSKSFDPLRDISFQFKRAAIQEKCTSAEAEIPICPTTKDDAASLTSTGGSASGSGRPPFVDSRSTSSGTSDMSDYIETLSLSSHSSSDATGDLRYMFNSRRIL